MYKVKTPSRDMDDQAGSRSFLDKITEIQSLAWVNDRSGTSTEKVNS